MILFRLAVALILMSTVSLAANRPATVKIDGYVRDTSGLAIGGVKVVIYSAGKKDSVKSARTDKDGYYKIESMITATYDILYSHSKMDLSTIEMLAEDKDQHISIKMYRRGEKRTADVYHENLQSVERLAFLIVSLKEDDRRSLIKEYKESGAGDLLKRMQVVDLSKSSDDVRLLIRQKISALNYFELRIFGKGLP